MDSYVKLKDIPSKLGLKQGAIVLVSSDIVDLGISCLKNGEKFDANVLIDSLQETVGSEGTLLFPTFNWDFCKGKTYDYLKSKSQVGDLGNVALKRSDFRRTRHPIYSFAVWGKDQEYLCSLDNITSWGDDSPFGYLKRSAAINLAINLFDGEYYTFIHHVEQVYEKELGINYRFHKQFTSLYRDQNGNEDVRTYSMFVRYLDLEDILSRHKELYEVMDKYGAVKNIYINGIAYTIIDMVASIPALKEFIKGYPYFGKQYFIK